MTAHSNEIRLFVGQLVIGRLEFLRPTKFEAWRTLDGLALVIPCRVVLDDHPALAEQRLLPLVSHLRATVYWAEEEVALAHDEHVYRTLTQDPARLIARLSAGALRRLEGLRDGGPVKLRIAVSGEVCTTRGNAVGEMVRSDPDPIWDGRASRPTVEIEYDGATWCDMLNSTGFGENVFVEIPLPPNPGPPWDEVWKGLRTARDALNRGGSTAWKSVITECRTALEKWREIEEPDLGPGLPNPTAADRTARTWDQRFDQLRWHLHHLTHDGVHGHADECTRDDAVLVLAMLAGLLAVRKP